MLTHSQETIPAASQPASGSIPSYPAIPFPEVDKSKQDDKAIVQEIEKFVLPFLKNEENIEIPLQTISFLKSCIEEGIAQCSELTAKPTTERLKCLNQKTQEALESLNQETKKVLEDLYQHAVKNIDEGITTANTAIAELVRARQINNDNLIFIKQSLAWIIKEAANRYWYIDLLPKATTLPALQAYIDYFNASFRDVAKPDRLTRSLNFSHLDFLEQDISSLLTLLQDKCKASDKRGGLNPWGGLPGHAFYYLCGYAGNLVWPEIGNGMGTIGEALAQLNSFGLSGILQQENKEKLLTFTAEGRDRIAKMVRDSSNSVCGASILCLLEEVKKTIKQQVESVRNEMHKQQKQLLLKKATIMLDYVENYLPNPETLDTNNGKGLLELKLTYPATLLMKIMDILNSIGEMKIFNKELKLLNDRQLKLNNYILLLKDKKRILRRNSDSATEQKDRQKASIAHRFSEGQIPLPINNNPAIGMAEEALGCSDPEYKESELPCPAESAELAMTTVVETADANKMIDAPKHNENIVTEQETQSSAAVPNSSRLVSLEEKCQSQKLSIDQRIVEAYEQIFVKEYLPLLEKRIIRMVITKKMKTNGNITGEGSKDLSKLCIFKGLKSQAQAENLPTLIFDQLSCVDKDIDLKKYLDSKNYNKHSAFFRTLKKYMIVQNMQNIIDGKIPGATNYCEKKQMLKELLSEENKKLFAMDSDSAGRIAVRRILQVIAAILVPPVFLLMGLFKTRGNKAVNKIENLTARHCEPCTPRRA